MKLSHLFEEDLPSVHRIALKLFRTFNDIEHVKKVEFLDDWVLHITTDNDLSVSLKLVYEERKSTVLVGIFEYNDVQIFKVAINLIVNFDYLLITVARFAILHEFRQKFPTCRVQCFSSSTTDEFQVSIKTDSANFSSYYRFCEQALEQVGLVTTEISQRQFNCFIQHNEYFNFDWNKLQQMKAIQ